MKLFPLASTLLIASTLCARAADEDGFRPLFNGKAPDKFVSKPGDQWQTAEATIIGNKISLTLNGVKVHDNVECTKATGSELDNKIDQPGSIFLQGDHGNASFRNIRIKELK